MDINVIRSVITVLCFAAFMGIVFWAWSAKRKAAFDEAANLPFLDDDDAGERIGAANPPANRLSGQASARKAPKVVS